MITSAQICQMVNGQLIGDAHQVISGPSKIEEGKQGTISFLANPKYESYLYTTEASVVLVPDSFEPSQSYTCSLIKVADVYQSLSLLLAFYQGQHQMEAGISHHAALHPSVIAGKDVAIDDFASIKSGVKIGDGCKIHAHVFLGQNVSIGNNVTLFSGVKIYHDCVIGNNVIIHANTVIGSDGFGFTRADGKQYTKIPHIGNVIIEDNVEIGANTVIDRASMGSTIIKSGAKLDNLIQIAHNVEIGEDTAIAAQTGIAGSTKVGKNCIIGGQVGLAGHITIADGTMIQAKSGISSNIKEPNAKLYGYPALEYGHYLKSYAYFKKLPEMAQNIKNIENQLQKINGKNE